MSNTPSFPVLAALSEELTKIANSPGNSPSNNGSKPLQPRPAPLPATLATAGLDTSLDVHRIADALERIATALEKLTPATNQNLSAQPNPVIAPSVAIPKPPATTPPLNGHTSPTINKTLPAKEIGVAIPTVKNGLKEAGVNGSLNPKASSVIAPTNLGQSGPNKATSLAPKEIGVAIPTVKVTEKSVLRTYLKVRGITLQEPKKDVPQNQAALDELALFLGQNFLECLGLYTDLKANLIVKPRNLFNYSLKGATLEQNKILQKFCELLNLAGLLEEYSYQGRPEFSMQLKVNGKEQKYLQGTWLESYVKQEVARITLRTVQPYEALPNLEIVFTDSSKTELDLFFALGSKVFCIETKMRPTSNILESYIEKIKPLGLDKKNILVVVAEKSEKACQELNQALEGVRVARLADFEENLVSWLGIGLG